jgi:tRNA 2-thiouridine synthesizing protein A
MSHTVDARGLSCPQPVILVKRALGAGRFPIEVLVDTVTARENVRRMAERAGFHVRVEPIGDEFKLTITH